MKRFTMLLLSLLLIATTGLFAEGAQETSAAGDRPRVEITKAYYFGEPTDNQEYKEAFTEWVSDYFGINFVPNAFPRPEYMQKFALAMTSGEIKGLGWIFGGSYMEDYYADGATVDIMPYAENNPNWMKLPEEMRQTNVRDGALLALPSGFNGGLGFARSIRTDWLENLGMDMPETVYELYDVVKAFTEDDPDGNGEDDTIGMTAAGVWNLQDIFMSFGTPTNHVGAHMITPDPHDGLRYNDGMLKPGAGPALEWLKRVYDDGYLDQEVFVNGGSQMRERMSSAKYGTTYYWASWGFKGSFENRAKKVDPEAEFDIILGLTSDYADKYVNVADIKNGGAPWVLIGGTKNPQEQVDAFIDIFLTDEIGFWSGRFGIYNEWWTLEDGNTVVRLPRGTNEEGKTQYYPGPGINTYTPEFNFFNYTYELKGRPEEENERRNRLNQIEADYIEEGFEKELFYRYPHPWSEPDSQTYRDIGADIQRIFEETVAKVVTGQVTVDEGLADYRRQVKNLGGQQVLDEGNAAIGKTSSTQWTY